MEHDRPHVLLIESETEEILRIRELIGNRVTLSIAASNKEAYHAVDKTPIDLILTTLSRPGIDGIDICRALKGNPTTRDIGIIMISQYDSLDDKVFGLQFGADDFLSSPYHSRELMARLQAQLRIRELKKELQEKNRLLHKLSITDDLTGLYNRRRFMDVMDSEVLRAIRYCHPLSLLMVDLDHFKKVNDEFGHTTGDEILKAISRTITDSFREVDVVARYGGEEFVILMPESDFDAADQAADRLRTRVEGIGNEVLPEPDRSWKITVSVGIATAPTLCGLESGRLFRAADRACYVAKERGRNQIVQYTKDLEQKKEVKVKTPSLLAEL